MVRDKSEVFYLAGHHRILVCEELYKIRSFEIFPLRKVFDYFKTYNFIIFAKSIAKLLLINYVCQIGDCQVSYTFSVSHPTHPLLRPTRPGRAEADMRLGLGSSWMNVRNHWF